MPLLYNIRQDNVNGGQSLRGFPAAATSLDPVLRNLALAEDVYLYLASRTFIVDGRHYLSSEKAVHQGSAENK